MKILQTLQGTAETEPRKWGSYETLPLPVQQRIMVIEAASSAVSSCAVVQEGVSARSQIRAAEAIDAAIPAEPEVSTEPATNFAAPDNSMAVVTHDNNVSYTQSQLGMQQAAQTAIRQYHSRDAVQREA